jgi:hypothetical protein
LYSKELDYFMVARMLAIIGTDVGYPGHKAGKAAQDVFIAVFACNIHCSE